LLWKPIIYLDQDALDCSQNGPPATKNEVLDPINVDLEITGLRNVQQVDYVGHREPENLVLENVSERSSVLIERGAECRERPTPRSR
jgi:hypothetical protein